MKRCILRLAISLMVVSAPLHVSRVWADAKPAAMPEKAVCQTCAARGAVHGEEDVVAWRQYEGAHYYFCSKKCGETFDSFPEAYMPRDIPRPAPQMVLTTMANKEVVLGKDDGNVVLLDFWATWCAPCLKAMPKLEKLQKEFAADGFSVVGISLDQDAQKFEKFLSDKQPSYPMVNDMVNDPERQAAWQNFYVVAIPAMVLIDGKGRVVGEWKGDMDLDEVRQAIKTHVGKGSGQLELD